MRITRNLLLETAHNHVKSLTFNNPDIACVFLIGSLVEEDSFLGDATDIDLVCIHNTEPASPREVVPVTDDFHFDILHLPRRTFSQPKELRHDPWLGCLFCEKPFVFFDSYHFFDFIRAGVFSNFFSPTNLYARSQFFYTQAREGLSKLRREDGGFTIDAAYEFLHVLWNAGNTIACLVGKPTPERSFLSKLENVTSYLGRPGLASGLRDMYGLDAYTDFTWEDWFQPLSTAFSILSEKPYCPPQLSPPRLKYFTSAISFYQTERPDEALWLLLWTWTNVVHALPRRIPEVKDWKNFLEYINLTSDSFSQKIQLLDTYLDALDETSEEWKKVSGLI